MGERPDELAFAEPDEPAEPAEVDVEAGSDTSDRTDPAATSDEVALPETQDGAGPSLAAILIIGLLLMLGGLGALSAVAGSPANGTGNSTGKKN